MGTGATSGAEFLMYIDLDAVFLSVKPTSKGILFRLTDYRQSSSMWCDYYIEPTEEKEFLSDWEGLFKIECTLGVGLANIIRSNAALN